MLIILKAFQWKDPVGKLSFHVLNTDPDFYLLFLELSCSRFQHFGLFSINSPKQSKSQHKKHFIVKRLLKIFKMPGCF